MTVKIYLVRHGETNFNKDGLIQGQIDSDINAEGFLQAAQTGRRAFSITFQTQPARLPFRHSFQPSLL